MKQDIVGRIVQGDFKGADLEKDGIEKYGVWSGEFGGWITRGTRKKHLGFTFGDVKKIVEISKVTQSDVNAALKGAFYFGATGAIVGSSIQNSRYTLAVYLKDGHSFIVTITVPRAYEELLGWGVMASASQPNETENDNSFIVSTADEIKKYKELLDMGAITQDEYDRKKKELLGF